MPKTLRLILFGATGMVGSGALRCCLEDEKVEAVLVIGRTACGVSHPNLSEILQEDFYNYSAIQSQLSGYNACLFCLGVSAAGRSEADYTRLTYDLTLAAAEAVLQANPGCAFAYVSGVGTDSSEKGPFMWARVKGRLENKLLSLPFMPAVMVRPGMIQPSHGERSRAWYQPLITLMKPLFPWLLKLFPDQVTTTDRLGRALLAAVRGLAEQKILEPRDINRLGTSH